MEEKNKSVGYLYGTATVGEKGQVVIPAEAREEMSIKSGDKLMVVNGGGGMITFIKVDHIQGTIDELTQFLATNKES